MAGLPVSTLVGPNGIPRRATDASTIVPLAPVDRCNVSCVACSERDMACPYRAWRGTPGRCRCCQAAGRVPLRTRGSYVQAGDDDRAGASAHPGRLSPRREGIGASPRCDLGVDPEAPVLPEFAGSRPATELRLALPGIAPAFRHVRGLPEPDEVIPACRPPDVEEPFAKAHEDLLHPVVAPTPRGIEGPHAHRSTRMRCGALGPSVDRPYLSLFGCGGSGVLFGLQATPGLNPWGSASPSLTSCP